jgi:hypothetical protein
VALSLALVSLPFAQEIMRTGLPDIRELLAAYSGSAAIAMAAGLERPVASFVKGREPWLIDDGCSAE